MAKIKAPMGNSKKKQGDSAKDKSLSDKREKPTARTEDRGMGSAFANAVKDSMEESKDLKGSDSAFLGVEKKTIDPKQYAHSLLKKDK